jgi:hypothetical protein
MCTHTQTRCTKSEICTSQDAWLIFITYPGTVKISSVIKEIDTPADLLSSYQTGRNFLKGFRRSPWRQVWVGRMCDTLASGTVYHPVVNKVRVHEQSLGDVQFLLTLTSNSDGLCSTNQTAQTVSTNLRQILLIVVSELKK